MTLGLIREKFKKTKAAEIISSGFGSIDEKVAGFKSGGVYVLAGLEKSGKSSLLMNMVVKWLRKQKVGFVNTELTTASFLNRMAGICFGHTTASVENNPSIVEDFIDIYENNLFYVGTEDILKNGKPDFNEVMKSADTFVGSGVKIIIFDNLTSFYNQPPSGVAGWQYQSQCVSRIDTLTKLTGVTSFVVLHTKQAVTLSIIPEHISDLIRNDDPGLVFEQSGTFIRRPTLNDVLGGTGGLSQINGAVLVWRPYQKYLKPELNQLALIILESMRDSVTCESKMIFDGEKKVFYEVDPINSHKPQFGTPQDVPELVNFDGG